MVAASKNFRAKRKPRRARSSLFARCSVAFAALGEEHGCEGNVNRIPIGGSCPIGISASLPQGRVSQRNDWGVTQRYIYSPYGSMIILNADFSTPPAGTQPISDYLYQGMTLDAVTGLYYASNRNYSPSLGVWISQDPAVYINGANTYQMEMSGPEGSVDARGLSGMSLPQQLPVSGSYPTNAYEEINFNGQVNITVVYSCGVVQSSRYQIIPGGVVPMGPPIPLPSVPTLAQIGGHVEAWMAKSRYGAEPKIGKAWMPKSRCGME